MNDGRAIANLVLDIADSEGGEITNLALQKILFFCHGWCIAKSGKSLIKQEFEAWQYGPVLQHVYREFKSFDRSPIKSRAKKLDPLTGEKVDITSDIDDETRAIVEAVTKFYSKLRPGTLVEMSHASGGPWDTTWNHGGAINPGMKMDNSEISEYFKILKAPF
ncbi:Panacea domain-containing protein [Xanthomonas campestris]|uniref:Panacea domain-containing protein n=1 Tax=Xanthomonas campestris TaxID=339 RepID=UPI0023657C0A|nr:type II toxin-antitoxin system antitoxin SocA domain-containing protein [Xanthomonas campestris]MEA9709925.1 type II toxin-antitoxin system antitoxin SocA domain-containing protein [Xanthomonas campestris]MEA9784061.1 type II toxin-antitoxin system antitoxin SocA domain-containing protein [Xanthomonas campestris pv. raphani]MEA9792810.1 type II toxin-antitoxin system antitoxin SocA domain-containing protein [Xanthomonas campestris pv. raphani]MEA9804371.1 type II toxin-antitoxin system antit